MILHILVAALSLGGLILLAHLFRTAMKAGELAPRGEAMVLGAVTNFFDTLGIGSFAPSIAWLRFRKLVPDRLIPLTMLTGYTPPAILQGVIFLILLGVQVDPLLILACVAAMIPGAYVGVSIAARAPVRVVQGIVGAALATAAFFYTLSNLGLMPLGGTATTLPLGLAAVVVAAHFAFGMLLNFGVGNFAPTLAMLSLMGMDPRLSFPIMAASAGFAGITASARVVSKVKLDMRMVVGLIVGAIPAVLVAAFVVKEMPLETLRWLVVFVVSYAAVTLLMAAARTPDVVPGDAGETAATHG